MISGGIEYYECAPDNKRIYKQTTDGYGTWTLYGAHGERVGTFGLGAAGPQDMGPGVGAQYRYDISVSGKSILFAGRMIQEAGASQKIDRLGSNRSNGARYYPYGEEIGSTANNHVKFATYTRDGFTGLDYADQRFYASTYGRFNTPDRLGGKLADPGIEMIRRGFAIPWWQASRVQPETRVRRRC
jgi:RHS repeat-associated protein